MPNDAKVGLIVGVGLVVAVAFVFFRKEPGVERHFPQKPPEAVIAPTKEDPLTANRGSLRQATAVPATRTETSGSGARHTVIEGETLYTLAQRYYGDKDKFGEILKVNRELVSDAENLTPGTVLTIPELPAQADASTAKAGS